MQYGTLGLWMQEELSVATFIPDMIGRRESI